MTKQGALAPINPKQGVIFDYPMKFRVTVSSVSKMLRFPAVTGLRPR